MQLVARITAEFDVTHEEWTVDQALVDASKASGAT
jgi:hypothetical protein